MGPAGVITLAGAAFAGLGGYAVGLLTVAGGWPAWLAVLVGPWAAVLVGTILFVPILKTRGHYLALVTIAFVFIFNILVKAKPARERGGMFLIPCGPPVNWRLFTRMLKMKTKAIVTSAR